jgi:hypothetical protein
MNPNITDHVSLLIPISILIGYLWFKKSVPLAAYLPVLMQNVF